MIHIEKGQGSLFYVVIADERTSWGGWNARKASVFVVQKHRGEKADQDSRAGIPRAGPARKLNGRDKTLWARGAY